MEFAKVLEFDTFLGQIPYKFDARFLPNFPGNPNVFQDFDNRY